MLTRVHTVLRYAAAVVAVILAATLHDAFETYWGGRMPFLTFYPAVIGIAWFAGAGPGIVATLLSAALATRIWIAVHGADAPGVGFVIAVGVFMSTGIAVSLLVAARNRARSSIDL